MGRTYFSNFLNTTPTSSAPFAICKIKIDISSFSPDPGTYPNTLFFFRSATERSIENKLTVFLQPAQLVWCIPVHYRVWKLKSHTQCWLRSTSRLVYDRNRSIFYLFFAYSDTLILKLSLIILGILWSHILISFIYCFIKV